MMGFEGKLSASSIVTLALPPPAVLCWRRAGTGPDGTQHAAGEYYADARLFPDLTNEEIIDRGLVKVNSEGPDHAGEWYDKALQLPATRAVGWFGTVLGSEFSNTDVQLLLHPGNHLKPSIRLIIEQDDLLGLYMGLAKLFKERFNFPPDEGSTNGRGAS
jgi:hypothetical protein